MAPPTPTPVEIVLAPVAGVRLPEGKLLLDDRSPALPPETTSSEGPGAGSAEPLRRGTLDGKPVDLLVLGPDERSQLARLVSFGKAGVGGAFAGGKWDGRLVVVYKHPQRTLADLAANERLPGDRVLAILEGLAEALACLESGGSAMASWPLRPADVVLDDEGAWLLATPIRDHLRHGAGLAGGTGPSPRWTPPEQAAGAPWDAEANRYVLGLVVYRLATGEHPFSGAGLRHALEAQAREAPPFEDEIARGLRPGFQALVLSLLHPDRKARPARASAIAAAARSLRARAIPAPALAAKTATTATPQATPASKASASPSPRSSAARSTAKAAPPLEPRPRVASARRKTSVARTAAVIAAGAMAVSAWALAPSAAPKAQGDIVPSRGPVTGRTAESCAPCHSRQVEEWRRSVMAFSSRSPLYRALESAVQEQVGRDARCPGGAGILRRAGAGACVDPATNLSVTGSGGEHWCVHCHAPLDQLASRVPTWNGTDLQNRSARAPLGDVLSREGLEGITCVACHTSVGPVAAHAARNRREPRLRQPGLDKVGLAGDYEGNPIWRSTRTGVEFAMRPEDLRGVTGISNSGYRLDPSSFFLGTVRSDGPMVHDRATASARAYLGSSEFCGACHDVRLFGSDVIGARDRGEHFKRLRNAYSEWRSWADTETRAGRPAASCQDCHMSMFPGICQPGAPRADLRTSAAGDSRADHLRSESCPPGTGFVAKAPGVFSNAGPSGARVASHYFTGVEVPMSNDFPESYAGDRSLDADGVPVGLRARRDLLLRSAFAFTLGQARVDGRGTLELPVEIINVGAGHRVPAGFSQEREFWVELRVTDARGAVVYEVGRVDRADQDLADKRFVRVRTDENFTDRAGRPVGMFGATIADGSDAPEWQPNPAFGGTTFRGRGLINFQNGFLRCVRCTGVVAADGSCQPGPGQGLTRADRFEDGDYDPDTGECRSNLSNGHELFETYFPIGALDAERGVVRAPDAIIDTRSAAPGVPLRYTYVLAGAGNRPKPLRVEARLRFRAFPPFLIRAFVAYERERSARGDRPSGPQMDEGMLNRLEIVDLAKAELEVR